MTEDLNKIVKEQQSLLEENAKYISEMEAVIHNLMEIIGTQTDVLSGNELWDKCPKCEDNQRFIKTGFCLTCSACVLDDIVAAKDVIGIEFDGTSEENHDIKTSIPDNVDDQIEENKMSEENHDSG